ncbi:MAG: ATP-grasp domain-containing protein [Bacteroidales bacterium]|nr:ATP-grasp domain-containing protein [Bacteroidales bacterium]
MMYQELKGKRLLILGGMRFSCEIVKKAQAMGIYTLVADYNKIEDSPGKQIADEAVDLSVIDVDAVVKYVKGNRIDGVFVGFNDMLLPYYAEICEKTGLPCYGTKEQFETLIAKDKYKSLCRQFGVPTIPEYDFHDENIKYPVLVKPVDSSGSRGITICHDRAELEKAVEVGRKASKTGEVLVERYMDGREVTVFWTFQNGNYYLSALANRHVKQNQGGDVIPLPVGYTFPSVFLSKYRLEVEENCKKMFRHLGIKDGMMFMQCKVEDGTCYLYDLGFRPTGSLEYKILNRVCGYDPLDMMICFALTGRMGEEDIAPKVKPEFETPAFNVSCLCAPGTIKEITGLDEVKKMPEVEDVVVAYTPGETITEQMRGLLAQISIRVLGAVDKKEQLLPTMQKINETLHILGEDGRELLLPGIEYEDINGYIF